MATQTRSQRIKEDASKNIFVVGPPDVATFPHPACETREGCAAVIRSLREHSRNITERHVKFQPGMELDVGYAKNLKGETIVRWHALVGEEKIDLSAKPSAKFVAIITPVLTVSLRSVLDELTDQRATNGWGKMAPVCETDDPVEHKLGVSFLEEVNGFFKFDGTNPTRADRAMAKLYKENPDFALRHRFVRNAKCVTPGDMVIARIDELAEYKRRSDENRSRDRILQDISSFARPTKSGTIIQHKLLIKGHNRPPKDAAYPSEYLDKIVRGCGNVRNLDELQTECWLSFPRVYTPSSELPFSLRQLKRMSDEGYIVYIKALFQMSRDGNLNMSAGERTNQNAVSFNYSEIAVKCKPPPECVVPGNILSISSMSRYSTHSAKSIKRTASVALYDSPPDSPAEDSNVPDAKRSNVNDVSSTVVQVSGHDMHQGLPNVDLAVSLLHQASNAQSSVEPSSVGPSSVEPEVVHESIF
tara:strand:- start:9359 stop:10777 length:1419 start_codon:yes stop_codon:yes gene_type:complete